MLHPTDKPGVDMEEIKRAKLRCPTCDAEIYVVVESPDHEQEQVTALWHEGHDRPVVIRYDTMSDVEIANYLSRKAEQQQ